MSLDGTYIRATQLIGLQELLHGHNIEVEGLLHEAGIPREALTNYDTVLTFKSFALLLELCASRLNRPSFGLEWTLHVQPNFANLGGLSLTAHLAGNVRDWIDVALRYWRAHTNSFTMRLIPGDQGLATFRIDADPFVVSGRQICEQILGNICVLTRVATGRLDEHPTLVRFQHSRPEDTSLHEKIFNCPVEFNSLHTEIVFESKILDYKTSGLLRPLKPLVNLYIRHRIDRLAVYDQSVSTHVALAIASVFGTGNCNLDFVASLLDLSPKGLQRRLTAEATTFSELLEKVRDSTARRLLADSDAPIERIAGYLDYASTPPFTLAFKRWTGQTPSEYRRSHKESVGADRNRLGHTK